MLVSCRLFAMCCLWLFRVLSVILYLLFVLCACFVCVCLVCVKRVCVFVLVCCVISVCVLRGVLRYVFCVCFVGLLDLVVCFLRAMCMLVVVVFVACLVVVCLCCVCRVVWLVCVSCDCFVVLSVVRYVCSSRGVSGVC